MIVEAIGVMFAMTAQVRSLPASPVFAYSSFALFAFGGVLIGVGTIRWAIWPLIEAAYKD